MPPFIMMFRIKNWHFINSSTSIVKKKKSISLTGRHGSLNFVLISIFFLYFSGLMILRNVEELNWAMDGHIMDNGVVTSDWYRVVAACDARAHGAGTSHSSHVRWHCHNHQSNHQNWTAQSNHSHSHQKGRWWVDDIPNPQFENRFF